MDTDPNHVQTAATPATQELDTLRLPSPPVDTQQQHEHAAQGHGHHHNHNAHPGHDAHGGHNAHDAHPGHNAHDAHPGHNAHSGHDAHGGHSAHHPSLMTPPPGPPAPVPAPVQQMQMDPMVEPESNVPPQVMTPGPYAYTTAADTDEYKRSCALNLTLRKKPKCIFAMAMGIAEFHGILDRPPLTSVKRKELTDLYVPKADDFKHEIKRRAHFFMNVPEEAAYFTDELKRHHPLKTKRSSVVLPQPNQWLNSALKKWLFERPMKPNDSDMEFLRSEIHRALEYLSKETHAEIAGMGLPKADMPRTPIPFTPKTPGMPDGTPVTPAPVFKVGDINPDPHIYSCPKDTEEFKRSAAATFIQRNHRPRAILAMALGMEEFHALMDHPPFTLVKKRDMMEDHIPRAEDYRFEIKRRAHFFMNMEEETEHYTKVLQRKNPLENMRGIVAIPQPNQWKLQQLKGWLLERPLMPNAKDSAFLRDVVKKLLDALSSVMHSDTPHSILAKSSSKKGSGVKASWMGLSDGNSVDSSGPGSKRRETLLLECITKQDAILGAVNKQTQQQTILNKITVLTQAISGYQQEISSLRSTINETDNRILTVEMRIAESPQSEGNLRDIIARQHESKMHSENKIRELDQLIMEARNKVEMHGEELEQLEMEMNGGKGKKRKFEDDVAGATEATV